MWAVSVFQGLNALVCVLAETWRSIWGEKSTENKDANDQPLQTQTSFQGKDDGSACIRIEGEERGEGSSKTENVRETGK